MSIYATLHSIQIKDPATSFSDPRWVEVTAQVVPAHIGSPTPGCGYEEGDPYKSFLPPAIETDENGEAKFHRAVVFIPLAQARERSAAIKNTSIRSWC